MSIVIYTRKDFIFMDEAKAYSEKKKAYNMQYDKENYKRIPFNVTHPQYDAIKAEADALGTSVNGYLKKAVDAFATSPIFNKDSQ